MVIKTASTSYRSRALFEFRHQICRNHARFRRIFLTTSHAEYSAFRPAGYSWASVTRSPIRSGDSYLETSFRLLRGYAEYETGMWTSRSPLIPGESWDRLYAFVESGAYPFRPIKLSELSARIRTLLHNQGVHEHWIQSVRFRQAMVICPAWNSLLFYGVDDERGYLLHWGTAA